tara:strand:- start:461 stop:1180 length:720 start_codon:yes stop_codon:yes gene_type:complete
MSLQDKNNNYEDTKDLVTNFIEANQRKRKNLINKIESSSDLIYQLGGEIFDDKYREGDDWSIGWILQVLKKNEPNFFDNKKFNNWFFTNSDVGIDYSELQLNLLEQDFEEADRLTSSYLRKMAGKVAEKRGYVFYSEVKNMSDVDLISIDRLWNIYSQGKFGFSIQAKLLKNVGKRYELLWPKIGWKIDGIWTRYPSSFDWSLQAPDGHMPLVNQLRGIRLMDSILRHPAIASRHNNCL